MQSSEVLQTITGNNYYFGWKQDDNIQNFLDNLPEGVTVNIIGHSYGADTGAKIAVKNPDIVNTLITVDPVSHSAPDFNDIKSSVTTWIDVNATGGESSGFFSDFFNGNDAALVGGHWGSSPNGIASAYVAASENHADFTNMMLTPLPGGKTPKDILGNSQ